MQPNISTVIRGGKKIQINRTQLVPGDILSLSEGDKIPADARIIESHKVKVIESALTGESSSVSKDSQWIGSGALGDLKNMVFSGTSIAMGRMTAVVVSTGVQTEMGKIALLITQAKSPKTPLEKRLEKLGKQIGIVVIALCGIVFALSYHQGLGFADALITAVALAVSAVPEGLPAVMTISLAVGVGLMAKKKALVRELRAVETLGSVTVIASDKTGTITENKMKVVAAFLEDKHITTDDLSELGTSETGKRMLEVAASCNDAELPNLGDPTEVALLSLADRFFVSPRRRLDETPFSSETKWMGTNHKIDGKEYEFIKGAPEVVSTFCKSSVQKEIEQGAITMAKRGLRTIAVAIREKKKKKAEFLGIFGLLDPPRKTARSAIEKAQGAGIRTVMITGDHAITAGTIAKKVGIMGRVIEGEEIEKMPDVQLQKATEEVNIFARVSPEHKVRICKALQKNGHVVAMTGDGVNDAPAIYQAEVGVSMGKVGTSVARQASDLVLLDDRYATIVAGVEEGRRIFSNIKKSVSFLMRTNFDEVFLILACSFFALPLPVLPIHILFLNLLTDSFPALSLAMEPAEEGSMKQKPRPLKNGFLHGQMGFILAIGLLGAFTEFCIFYFFYERLPLPQVQTLVFSTLILAELALIFSVRTDTPFLHQKHHISKNPWVFRSVVLAGIFLLLGIFSPLHIILKLEPFPVLLWSVPIINAGFFFFLSEFIKSVSWKRQYKVSVS